MYPVVQASNVLSMKFIQCPDLLLCSVTADLSGWNRCLCVLVMFLISFLGCATHLSDTITFTGDALYY